MGTAERFRVLKPLGTGAAGKIAFDTSERPPRPVVLERAPWSSLSPDDRARVSKRCRALVGFEHPKVVPIHDVTESHGELVVACDFVDGAWLSALLSLDQRPAVELLLRIVLDVLEGLAALHDVSDERGQRLRLVHGGLSPSCVLVADDGVAEIARPFGVPVAKPDRFVAPELRRGEVPADLRADVYSVGAILRDVIGTAPANAKWAEQLTDVAWRACSVDPENRWPSAAAMATTLRRLTGPKLASSEKVAEFVRRHFGARIHARRVALGLADDPPPSSSEPIRPWDMEIIDPPSAPGPDSVTLSHAPPAPPVGAVGRKPVELPEIPEPAIEKTLQKPVGTVTQRWMPVVNAPPPVTAPLPPPDIIVPDVIVPLAPPLGSTPPSRVAPAVVDVAPSSDEPTEIFHRPPLTELVAAPVVEPVAAPVAGSAAGPVKKRPPPRFGTVAQATAIAAAIVSVFAVGWWFGHSSSPPADVPSAVQKAADMAPASLPAASEPPKASEKAAPPSPPVTTSSAQEISPSTSSLPVVSAPADSAAVPRASNTSAAEAVAPAIAPSNPEVHAPVNASTASAAPLPTPMPSPTAVPTSTTNATTNTSATAVPRPTNPDVPPTATTVAPRPGPPRPAGSAGYVPSEL